MSEKTGGAEVSTISDITFRSFKGHTLYGLACGAPEVIHQVDSQHHGRNPQHKPFLLLYRPASCCGPKPGSSCWHDYNCKFRDCGYVSSSTDFKAGL